MKVILTNKTKYILPSAKILQKIAKNVLKNEKQPTKKIAVGVYYVEADEIHSINKEYRNKDKETDVITFRLIDNPENLPISKANFPCDFDDALGAIYIGEIFICVEVAEAQATEWGHSLSREVGELFVHGMLHVLGHDHELENERNIMKERECAQAKLLDKLIK
ncbi:MAG: rRNA maturation RNase YbeY [Clostridia bacterium]|nr:rRNA maturation RNase YbeY [Clostridia bacterium]